MPVHAGSSCGSLRRSRAHAITDLAGCGDAGSDFPCNRDPASNAYAAAHADSIAHTDRNCYTCARARRD